MENLKIKRKKGQIFFDLPDQGFEFQIYSDFPPMVWIFMWSEESEIKSKQASKRDRALKDHLWAKWRQPFSDIFTTQIKPYLAGL